jgi:hypothetical protein
MTELSTTSVETFATGLISDASGVAAVVISATVVLGLSIFLVFKGLSWLKGGL